VPLIVDFDDLLDLLGLERPQAQPDRP
jgi:hypothetical protein